MSVLSSSQEMQLEYVTWRPPESPPIDIRRRAMEGIHREVNEAFASAPHRSAETGGILLGRRAEDRIVVEDFEPVPSEHRFGPCYRLSDADRAQLEETVEWFRGGAQPGLSVLGYYRSQTAPDFELSREDEELRHACFAADEDLVLLVKPSLMGISDEDFCFRRCVPQAGPPAAPAPPPLMSWPAPRPRQSVSDPDPEGSGRRRWPWYAAAMLLGLALGALGYVWWHPGSGPARIAVATAATPAVQQPPPQPVPPAANAEGIVEGTPVPSTPDTSGVRLLLDRWAGALKRGDADAAAQCYAAVVSTYFDRHAVTRQAVRQSIRKPHARYGHLDVFRISDLGITPVSEDRAVATFRKHWRMSGHGKSSGEEQERMTLVRTAGVWHISSEQAETAGAEARSPSL
jgi:hypothetical protein